ncbi:Trp biosynthesis-associated membrane protein [Xylanimonas protaetiae]|uniref:Trp biosynthesis protein n=1 Tax=Xylanimonas protaetiae TaxID=2509457 RepID=A0A4P6F4L3_9MICO|nr:Trp biosynthesis-associated membrane protein [Xylanimonas protaetiae]QAY70870.1 Trp biosynthesis protein [Xylanimonas protaetiae]
MPQEPQGAPRTGPLTRGRAALLLVVLGALVLATAGPAWVHARTATALDPSVAVAVTGGAAAPAVNAAAFVVVAAGLALALVGRRARWVVLAVVAASGVLVAASSVGVALHPDDVAAAGAGESVGVTDLTAPATVTAWPWLAAVVGVLVVVAAVATGVLARRWTATSSRHERTPAAPGPDRTVDSHDAWDALTRGSDPTAPQDR